MKDLRDLKDLTIDAGHHGEAAADGARGVALPGPGVPLPLCLSVCQIPTTKWGAGCRAQAPMHGKECLAFGVRGGVEGFGVRGLGLAFRVQGLELRG
jgi:hypothetical protein